MTTTCSHCCVEVKCFDFKRAFTDYIGYMGKFLDSKAITSEHAMRDTNRKRNRTNECVWTDPAIQTEIKHFMKENYDYYSFCDTCLGSTPLISCTFAWT